MSAFLRKYAVATHLYVPMIKRGVVDYAVSADWTPATGDVKVSIDGGAAANIGTLPTAVAMGNTALWDFTVASGETTGKKIVITVADSATKAVEDQFLIIETYGSSSGEYGADLSDGVRLGLTALPNAAAEASGGLYTRGTGAGQINQDANGRVDTNVKTWIGGTIPAVNVTGVPKVDVVDWLGTAPLALSSQQVQAVVPSSTVVASVTGAVGSVTGAVGSISGVTFPTNFGDLSITASTGYVNVGKWLGSTPNALISGRVDANTQATAATLTFDQTGSVSGSVGSVTGAVGSVTGNVGGNVVGTVASVVGAVGSVTGAVGSVTGNVGGNVVGSVASVTAGVSLAATESQVVRANTAQAGGASTITLDASASATDSIYVGAEVYIYGGTGAGQTRVITGYVGSTKVATVDRAWQTNPGGTSTFQIRAKDSPKTDSSLAVTAGSATVVGSVNVASFDAGAITSAAFASGAIDATAFAQGAADKVWSTTTRQLTGTQTFNLTGSITGSLSGSVGSVTGSVGSISGVSFPTNFSSLAINGSGRIDVGLWLGTAPLALSSQQVQAVVPSSTVVASVTGAVGSVTGSVGSVTGAVGSVTGAVGSVTGNVGGNVVGTVASVVGAVGSVTGNVGGNVTGSVGSVASGGITSGSFASAAITAAAIATDALGALELSADAVAEIVTAVWTEALPGSYASGTAGYDLGTVSTRFLDMTELCCNGDGPDYQFTETALYQAPITSGASSGGGGTEVWTSNQVTTVMAYVARADGMLEVDQGGNDVFAATALANAPTATGSVTLDTPTQQMIADIYDAVQV